MSSELRLTDEQRALARHALGLPNRESVSYRNSFKAGPRCVDHAPWVAMVKGGAAFIRHGSQPTDGDDIFCLTRRGAEAALEPGEMLDPEDFPRRRRSWPRRADRPGGLPP